MTDTEYMNIAINLAKKGCGFTNPNPMVGAVIVKNDKIIGMGWHERYGGLHAERNALNNCICSPSGATIYVTLEPCCHYGNNPPCTDAIIENGIAKVVIGAKDPNPLVSGKGIRILKEQGIEVVENILNTKCLEINKTFFHYIKTGTPYVTMKYAMTMDGKIATYTGASKWITCEESRMNVQRTRHEYQAVMAGVGTILADDPMLTCRIESCISPVRIICDTNLRTPVTSQIIKSASTYKTIIATSCSDSTKYYSYEKLGCTILNIPLKYNHLDLKVLMKELGQLNICSILLEGGGTLNWSALSSGIVNKVQAYIAPKIFGGTDAISPVEGIGARLPQDSFSIINTKLIQIGNDILMEGDVNYNVYRNN